MSFLSHPLEPEKMAGVQYDQKTGHCLFKIAHNQPRSFRSEVGNVVRVPMMAISGRNEERSHHNRDRYAEPTLLLQRCTRCVSKPGHCSLGVIHGSENGGYRVSGVLGGGC